VPITISAPQRNIRQLRTWRLPVHSTTERYGQYRARASEIPERKLVLKMYRQPVKKGPVGLVTFGRRLKTSDKRPDAYKYHVVSQYHGDTVEWAIGYLEGSHLLQGRKNPGQTGESEKSGPDPNFLGVQKKGSGPDFSDSPV
jgi:hypothetical protein